MLCNQQLLLQLLLLQQKKSQNIFFKVVHSVAQCLSFQINFNLPPIVLQFQTFFVLQNIITICSIQYAVNIATNIFSIADTFSRIFFNSYDILTRSIFFIVQLSYLIVSTSLAIMTYQRLQTTSWRKPEKKNSSTSDFLKALPLSTSPPPRGRNTTRKFD